MKSTNTFSLLIYMLNTVFKSNTESFTPDRFIGKVIGSVRQLRGKKCQKMWLTEAESEKQRAKERDTHA